MMPFAAMRLRTESGAVGLTGTWRGAQFAVNATSSVATLSVPAAVLPGDTLIAILRCRGDRSFSIPTDWTLISTAVFPSGTSTNATFVYVVSKPYAGESSVSFTQSANAAYGFALMAVKGAVVTVGTNYTGVISASINKIYPATLLVAIALNSNFSTSNPPFPMFTGYTNRGITSVVSGSTRFFGAVVESLEAAPTGVQSISATWSTSTIGSQGAVLLEIGS